MKGLIVVFMLASLVVCLVSFSVADESLRLYFDFEKVVDGKVKDQSGNENDGTLKGNAKIGEGKLGNGLELHGGGDCVEVLDSPSLDITGEITITTWLKKPAGGGWQGIVDKWEAYVLMLASPGDNLFGFIYDNGAQQPAVAEDRKGKSIISPDTWHHVAMTYDGETDRLYLDGELDGEGPYKWDKGDIDTSDKWLGIGGRDPGADYFSGAIDEVAIYSRALELEEIKKTMEEGVSPVAVVDPLGKLTTSWGSIKAAY